MFRDDHPATLSIPWLFNRAMTEKDAAYSQIIATTKLFVWMQLQLNGWNYPVNLILNFLIFGFFPVVDCLVPASSCAGPPSLRKIGFHDLFAFADRLV
jgi:hypothetical protein